jgi:regulator of protease activity HflC (stomatin/prohibitin superfamily)
MQIKDWEIPVKQVITISVSILAIVIITALIPLLFGINDAGERTLIQYPNGTLKVKFTPGIYLQLFGSIEVYKDVLTVDFDKIPAEGEASIDLNGISVRYQDGGTGTIYGKARFNLPNDEEGMIKTHKAFRSNNGVAVKLIKPVVQEGMNLTAGLMSSEEAYTEKRNIFIQWAEEQISKGKFKTKLQEISIKDESTGKEVIKNIPVIDIGEDGAAKHYPSDLLTYSITVSGFQITDWDFEPKTLEQISKKREATMAIITAKADAERAKQEAITTEAKGKANVMQAKYEKEVEKEKAVVEASQRKEVAIIEASQKVDVAEQKKKEAEQLKLAAAEYKQEQILKGEGDAAYKRAVMQADGALKQKLETYEKVAQIFATEFGKQKWVPEIAIGKDGESNQNAAVDLMNLLLIKTAKDLSLDLNMGDKKIQETSPVQ